MDRLEYKCNICKKDYSSYKSLWLHNYKYHNTNISSKNNPESSEESSKESSENNPESSNKIYKCRKCNKEYKYIQGRWKHEQKCKFIENNKIEDIKDIKINKMEEEIEKLKQQINATKSNVQNAHSITNNIDNSQKIINNFGSNNSSLG
jgi:DNA-directed RNA polymerase subunit RPC12/RpoP